MELTNDQTKIDLVGKLVKDGVIDFNQALLLLSKDVQFISFPYIPEPLYPVYYRDLFITTCES